MFSALRSLRVVRFGCLFSGLCTLSDCMQDLRRLAGSFTIAAGGTAVVLTAAEFSSVQVGFFPRCHWFD